jgi:hypothetical protein
MLKLYFADPKFIFQHLQLRKLFGCQTEGCCLATPFFMLSPLCLWFLAASQSFFSLTELLHLIVITLTYYISTYFNIIIIICP